MTSSTDFDDTTPRLPDPLDERPVPPIDTATIDALFAAITSSRPPRRRWPYTVALATAAAVLVIALVVSTGGGGRPAPAAALAVAFEQTSQVESGTFTVSRVFTAGDRSQSQTVDVAFDGADYAITFTNEGSIIDHIEGQSTPPVFRVRNVDGQGYVHFDGRWSETIGSTTTNQLRTLGERIDEAVEAAEGLDTCPTQSEATTSYCVTTTDPALVSRLDVQSTQAYTEIAADIRIDVSDETGLLTALAIDATDAVVDPSSTELVVPPHSFHSEADFGGLGEPVTIEVPEVER